MKEIIMKTINNLTYKLGRTIFFYLLFYFTFFSSNIFSQTKDVIKYFNIDKTDRVIANYGNYYENNTSAKYIQSLNEKFDLIISKLDREIKLKMDSIFQIANNQSNNFNDFTKKIQKSFDTLMTDSYYKNKNIDEIKTNTNKLINNINSLQEYTSIKKENNEYIIDLNPLKLNNKIIFQSDFSEGFARIFKYNTWGFVNEKNEVVIDYQFEDAGYFENGLAPVKKNGKWFYINPKNEIILDLNNVEFAWPFYNGKALIKLKDKSNCYQIINTQKEITETFNDVSLIWSNSKYYLLKDSYSSIRFKLVNYEGETILSGKSIISQVSDEIVYYKDKVSDLYYSFFNCQTKQILISTLPYVKVTLFINGLAVVTDNNENTTIINTYNAAQLPLINQSIIRLSENKFEIKYGEIFKRKIIINEKSKCLFGNYKKYNNNAQRQLRKMQRIKKLK